MQQHSNLIRIRQFNRRTIATMMTAYKPITILFFGLMSFVSGWSQTNTIASDTIKINGQGGNVKLVTGNSERTLNFPTQSGTLALEGSGSGSGQCCPTDTSFIIMNGVANTAATYIAVSESYEVGRFGRELILAVFINMQGVLGDARVILETCSDLNSPAWFPIIDHNTGGFQNGALRSWVVRPAGTSELGLGGGGYNFNETQYTQTFQMKGWMKYIRMTAILWRGNAGKSIVANITVR